MTVRDPLRPTQSKVTPFDQRDFELDSRAAVVIFIDAGSKIGKCIENYEMTWEPRREWAGFPF